MEHISNYDLLFAVIILISTLLAIIRGGVTELLSLSTWIIAIIVMRKYAQQIGYFIPAAISNHWLRSLIIYIIAFIIVAIFITVIKIIFNKAIAKLGLGGLNYLLGAIFGVIRGFILCALVLIVLEILHIDSKRGWDKSWFAPILVPTVNAIVNAIPLDIKNINTEIGKGVGSFVKAESI